MIMFGILSRMQRERMTIDKMLRIYCSDHHGTKGCLCGECQELKSYATQRLDRCLFQAQKTTCAKCTIHCYREGEREKVRQVMRYAGPRMPL